MERRNINSKKHSDGVLIIKCNYPLFRLIGGSISCVFAMGIIVGLINIENDLPELIGSIILFVLSVILVILTPYWADKVFPYFFRKHLILDDKTLKVKKKDKVLFDMDFKDVSLVYRPWYFAIPDFSGGCQMFICDKEKVDSDGNKIMLFPVDQIHITRAQYRQIKEWIKKNTDEQE